jgi:hypothetical protein
MKNIMHINYILFHTLYLDFFLLYTTLDTEQLAFNEK